MSFINWLGDWLRKVAKSFTKASFDENVITLTRHDGESITLNLSDTYVKKSGDTMSGVLFAQNIHHANKTSSWFFIAGDTWNDGAWIRMDSKDSTSWPSHVQIGSDGENGNRATLVVEGAVPQVFADCPIKAPKFIGATATQSEAGLMSESDKTKLDGIAVMTAASANAGGAQGLVPSPAAGDQNKCLLGNKTWDYPTYINTVSAGSNGARPIWFSYLGDNTRPVYNTNFQYNPATGRLDVGNINGYTIEKSVPFNAVFTDTTYTVFVQSGANAKEGLVPKPPTNAGTTKYLCENGTWDAPNKSITRTFTPDTTYITTSYTSFNVVPGGTIINFGFLTTSALSRTYTGYVIGTFTNPPAHNSRFLLVRQDNGLSICAVIRNDGTILIDQKGIKGDNTWLWGGVFVPNS